MDNISNKTKIFGEFGSTLAFIDVSEMKEKLQRINLEVNNLSSNIETERYYIINFIKALVINEILNPPIEIIHLDDGIINSVPDFLVKSVEHKFYLEATMATTQELIIELKELDKFKNANKDKLYTYNIRIINDKIKIELIEVKKKLTGRPILGDMPETIFAKLIYEAIQRKTVKITNYDIEKDRALELLIYYQFPPMGGIDFEKGLGILQNLMKMNGFDYNNTFTKIHILRDRVLFYDILSSTNIKVIHYA